ncbi:UNVERIFIED_CONTAM: hypothetical protein H355_015431 [Colinus virginianus]|nr:hypothetical protein H355_015431 [Colinus virginianus]
MAFSAWQLLSPVQWARWTWSAVRGGGGPDGEDGGVGGDAEEEEEEEVKPPAFRQRGPAGQERGSRRSRSAWMCRQRFPACLESGNASLFSPPLSSSDSEGNYETPEAETPTCSALKEPSELQPEAGTRGKGSGLRAFCS